MGTRFINTAESRADAGPVATQIGTEAEHFSRLLQSAEAKEARLAMRERRRPDFRAAEAAANETADQAVGLIEED